MQIFIKSAECAMRKYERAFSLYDFNKKGHYSNSWKRNQQAVILNSL